MSIAPEMTIEETMVHHNPDFSVLEAAKTAKTRAGGDTCRHCFTCGSADHFMANYRMTGELGNEMRLFQRDGK